VLRNRSVQAWRTHYSQLNTLFSEVKGFEQFMTAIADNLFEDNVYGMMYRVSVGAALSSIDTLTEVYVI